ncbi:E3 ubiquitin-protein ligase TRIM45 isoform X2 [Magallana gigas]|uniref:E3 ubiquitin-protein ligase TRIM45 isoform X2 n=1 Tax=Magallana gigas TaxID=29159 RepID=UPI003340ED09
MMASGDDAQHLVECNLCQQPVSFFCRQCGVNLCDTCIAIHLRVKSKNGHDIVAFASKNDDDTWHCDSHPQNDCSAYCITCDAPICMLCVSIKHKSHEMSELSDKIDDLLKVIAKENDRLQSSKHKLERVLEHTTKLLSSISSIYKQRKDEVTARGEEWHKQIEETVKKLHQELDDMQKEHETVLQKQKKELEEMIDRVNEVNRKTRKLQKSKNVKEMQTFVPVIQKQKNFSFSEVSQYSVPKSYEHKIDEYLDIILNEKKSSDRRMLGVPTVTCVIDTGFPADKIKKNRLYDMAVTVDNKVWMGGHSKELKLFDLQGNLHHTVSITTEDIQGDKIHMLNRDGRFLRYIIPEGGIKDPRSVCILGDGEMMVGENRTGIAKRIKYLEE